MCALQYDSQLHDDLISGKKRAIAWGKSQDAHIRLHNAPYQFEAIIDGLRGANAPVENFAQLPVWGPKDLSRCPPSDYVIVVLADAKQFGAQIERQVNTQGKFALTLPYDPSRHAQPQPFSDQLIKSIAPCGLNSNNSDQQTVLLCLPNLFKGGADRQMVLLAVGLRLLKKRVCLVTHGPDAKGTENWQAMLDFHGVERVFAPQLRKQTLSEISKLNSKLTGILAPRLVNLFNTLVKAMHQFKPGLVISFLDNANVIASLAAYHVSGTHVVMSGRSQAPIDVPGFTTMLDFPVMQALYRTALKRDNISMVCNSPSGQNSYQRWLGSHLSPLGFIENAVYLEHTELQPIRRHLNIAESDRLLCGVMRMIESKRPLDFVNAVHRAHLKYSDIIAVIVGDGPLYSEVTHHIEALNAQSYIKLVGVQESALPYMAVSDAFLHTSCVEGTANVLLEAQAMELPVFAYEADETRHAVNKVTLHLANDGDVTELGDLVADKLVYRQNKRGADGQDFADAIRMAKEYLAQNESDEQISSAVKQLG